MTELKCPVCPICEDVVLLPFSISQRVVGTKIFGSWICTRCGFFISTDDSRGCNPTTGFFHELRKKIQELKKIYQKEIAPTFEH